jgi:exosome complex exonuclease RRP6
MATEQRPESGDEATQPAAAAAAQSSASSSSSSTLRQLLAALAAGARAVQGLPTIRSNTRDAGDDDDGNDDDLDGDDVNNSNQFAFESSFPEFSNALQQATGTLMETLTQAFASLDGSKEEEEEEGDDEEMMSTLDTATTNAMMQDPSFWEQCADACDLLVEQVEAQIEHNNNTSTTTTTTSTTAANSLNTWKQWSVVARQQSHVVSLQHMQQRLVDMEKPQIAYQIAPPVANNDRRAPFIPRVEKKKPHALVPLDLTLQPGHGLETAGFVNTSTSSSTTTTTTTTTMSGNKESSYLPDDIVAPSHHVPHPYATEIQQFVYQPWQLEKPDIIVTDSSSSNRIIPIIDHDGKLSATWIDTPRALNTLHDKLMAWSSSNSNSDAPILELAMDLEAHSFRSFAGLVCLMQISIRKQQTLDSGDKSQMDNYLIDTLKLHDHMHDALADVLANPRVCKVLHGADSDVVWLQRDFGLYIVNLFDTGRAARALALPGGAGYANLLSTYVFAGQDKVIDKSHQLSDWRQRPLPHDMQQYAIQDTHYLLDIAQQLRLQLYHQGGGGGSQLLQQVLDTSRQVCSIRYAGVEPFKPSGYYQSIVCCSSSSKRGGKNVKLEWTPRQQAVCKALWDWRDATARRLDESIPYICSNRLLGRLSMAMPSTVQQVQAIIASSTSSTSSTSGPISKNGILQHQLAPEVVQCTQQAIRQFEQDEKNKNNDDEEDEDEEMQNAPTTTAVSTTTTTTTTVQSSSSAFFKPSSASKERQRRGMMSPVLGTEALYKQAGWMTPKEQQARSSLLLRAEEFAAMTTTTSTSDDEDDELEAVDDEDDDEDDEDDDDDDDDNINKPRRLLSIQTCNKSYITGRLAAAHGLELAAAAASAPTTPSRGRTVDGMATVLAAREAASQSPL